MKYSSPETPKGKEPTPRQNRIAFGIAVLAVAVAVVAGPKAIENVFNPGEAHDKTDHLPTVDYTAPTPEAPATNSIEMPEDHYIPNE